MVLWRFITMEDAATAEFQERRFGNGCKTSQIR
jgi:hypothetical protein